VKLLGKPGNRRPEPLNPDTDAIRALAGLLAETGLSEIEYAVGDHRIRIARSGAGPTAAAANGHAPAAAPTAANGGPPAPAPATDAAAQPGTAAQPADAQLATVSSPMVGIAYLAPEPGADPFVRVGDVVAQGQPLLIIEAMKVMNQIRAPQAGRIARVLVADAAPVEYGTPLMLIE
jgi:acetyl-CoA carboxylase biotin carboxyl carrier protein